ncbi:hypothetical protein [Lichenibacterium dinghuense]|uniref:hypothetical protein n=1 Tax=Lichenibacterium dinghuense TaxID=2895977 RepID=UPI001F2BA95E|nr:hypothetical protein [Lichenibacterium sp. 6Y81]
MSATAALTAATFPCLIRVLADEYTPASVAADPSDASRLDLVRAADGNYATPPLAAFGVLAAAAAASSAGVQAGLYGLRLGG